MNLMDYHVLPLLEAELNAITEDDIRRLNDVLPDGSPLENHPEAVLMGIVSDEAALRLLALVYRLGNELRNYLNEITVDGPHPAAPGFNPEGRHGIFEGEDGNNKSDGLGQRSNMFYISRWMLRDELNAEFGVGYNPFAVFRGFKVYMPLRTQVAAIKLKDDDIFTWASGVPSVPVPPQVPAQIAMKEMEALFDQLLADLNKSLGGNPPSAANE